MPPTAAASPLPPRALAVLLAGLLAACQPPLESPAARTGSADRTEATRAASAPGLAVVELFTSEGCSSCPPADAVLRDLAARADSTGEAILPLSFHVDYWNRLGWADPYSEPAYTARQRAYASADAFERRVYTPAMIVNGTAGFVGSNRATAQAQIASALTEPARATVRLAARAEGRTVAVEHRVDGAPRRARLHLALVEDETAQEVTRGENSGRRLTYARVVRAFTTVAATEGTTRLTAPDDLDLSRARIVGYVQPGDVGEVLGAAQVHL